MVGWPRVPPEKGSLQGRGVEGGKGRGVASASVPLLVAAGRFALKLVGVRDPIGYLL